MQPLVGERLRVVRPGELCLIKFHDDIIDIQAVIDTSDHLIFVITGIWREGRKFRETAVLQNRMHLSQRKFFDLLGAQIHIPLLHSPAMPCTSTHPRRRRRGYDTGGASSRSHHLSLIRLCILPVMMRLEILPFK